MYKKIFSAILFGAFTLASTSTFVSCKDYDDDIKDLQSQITSNDNDIAALQTELSTTKASLEQELSAAKTALEAEIANAKKELNAAIEAGDAQVLADAKKAISDAEAKLNAAIQSGDEATLKAAKQALEEAEARLNAAIEAGDKATLNAAKQALTEAEARLNAAIEAGDKATAEKAAEELKKAKEQLEAAIATKADKAVVEALETRVATLELNLKAVEAKFDAQIQKINEAIDAFNEALKLKADKSELEKTNAKLEEALTKLTSVTGRVDKLETDYKALATRVTTVEGVADQNKNDIVTLKSVQEQLKTQVAALEAFKKKIEEADFQTQINNLSSRITTEVSTLNTKIDNLKTELNGLISKNASDIAANKADITQLKADVQELDERITREVAAINSSINALSILVQRQLASISLVPQLFVDGIEAIEFRSLQYTPKVAGTSGLTPVPNVQPILIDNGTAEAYYRLNPATVKRESIDEDKIKFYAATAETRAANVTSPVAFNGIATWNYSGVPGLIKVNLKKTITGSLNNPGNRQDMTYIVALSVPRKADPENGVEAAQIVSENSRLVENTFTPVIARLAWSPLETLNGKNIHHYLDSTTIYQSKVDNNELVFKEVVYNQTFNVRDVVTGCYGSHSQITKDELKTYGLEFRFAIPTKEYKNDVDHSTDQQQFAVIDPVTGVISSKLPNGVVENKACVGKEPIIRIMLWDTRNNKIVDERYMKIKWVDEPIELLPDQTLDPFTSTKTLDACGSVTDGVTWKWFIEKVYAVAAADGLSQQTFESIYPVANITYSNVAVNPQNATPATLAASMTPGKPVVAQTTNEQGDALIASWTLSAPEIARIYPSQSKAFKCTITFVSTDRSRYPNLKMDWTFNVTLPKLPKINGYYDNYWYEKYTSYDVLPVQYNTKAYEDYLVNEAISEGGLTAYAKADNTVAQGTPYCVYYNNLMNAFTYEQVNGSPRFIVKGLSECSTWDMQFTKAGADKYNSAVTYTQYPNYAPWNNVNALSPDITKDTPWDAATGTGYRLFAGNGNAGQQALQLVWDEGHTTWCGNPDHKQAYLYADHLNEYNQKLINPLDAANEADGLTPKRTHTKPVHVGIWATINDWNIIPVKDYDIYLVAPIRINADLKGAFEEGYISGTAVSCADAFTLTDFRGYTVAQVNGNTEWTKYATELWKYYEVGAPVWMTDQVKYGFKQDGASIKQDDTKTYANAMTAADVSKYTNGNINLSIELKTGADGKEYLVFKNNGGSNVEEEVNVFIPVKVTYGFGEIVEYCKVRLYPKGKVAAGVTIVPFN